MKKPNSKSMHKYLISVPILIGSLILISCGAGRIPVKTGQIVTPGVEIHAADSSFVLRAGERWTPPFQSATDWDDQNDFYHDGTTGRFDFALRSLDAERVIVKTPYLQKDLYGVLLLNEAIEGCNGPVTRSYQISIPEAYVKKALNGKVSVLYEYYSCHGLPEIKTWVLWLSDVPF